MCSSCLLIGALSLSQLVSLISPSKGQQLLADWCTQPQPSGESDIPFKRLSPEQDRMPGAATSAVASTMQCLSGAKHNQAGTVGSLNPRMKDTTMSLTQCGLLADSAFACSTRVHCFSSVHSRSVSSHGQAHSCSQQLHAA